MTRLSWGILGVAKIATTKVIPAMQKSDKLTVAAIASRDLTKAQDAANALNIPKAYGSYEEMLADPEIQCVYNPLPNHLHVPWSIKAAEAGKHVLCEKPISMTVDECRDLIAARDRNGVKIGEAFMVRTHPQWLRARDLVRTGAIGELRSIVAAFSYFNRDPNNVRNMADIGGGGLMDIGCYPIQIARYLFERDPARVTAAMERDPEFGTDRLTSGLMDFESGHCVFTCSTQLTPYQRVQILGTHGRIEIEIPFNAPPDKPTRIWVNEAVEEFPICDQYTIQAELFGSAVTGSGPVPTPLEDSLGNMSVIEAMFRSAKDGASVVVTAK